MSKKQVRKKLQDKIAQLKNEYDTIFSRYLANFVDTFQFNPITNAGDLNSSTIIMPTEEEIHRYESMRKASKPSRKRTGTFGDTHSDHVPSPPKKRSATAEKKTEASTLPPNTPPIPHSTYSPSSTSAIPASVPSPMPSPTIPSAPSPTSPPTIDIPSQDPSSHSSAPGSPSRANKPSSITPKGAKKKKVVLNEEFFHQLNCSTSAIFDNNILFFFQNNQLPLLSDFYDVEQVSSLTSGFDILSLLSTPSAPLLLSQASENEILAVFKLIIEEKYLQSTKTVQFEEKANLVLQEALAHSSTDVGSTSSSKSLSSASLSLILPYVLALFSESENCEPYPDMEQWGLWCIIQTIQLIINSEEHLGKVHFRKNTFEGITYLFSNCCSLFSTELQPLTRIYQESFPHMLYFNFFSFLFESPMFRSRSAVFLMLWRYLYYQRKADEENEEEVLRKMRRLSMERRPGWGEEWEERRESDSGERDSDERALGVDTETETLVTESESDSERLDIPKKNIAAKSMPSIPTGYSTRKGLDQLGRKEQTKKAAMGVKDSSKKIKAVIVEPEETKEPTKPTKVAAKGSSILKFLKTDETLPPAAPSTEEIVNNLLPASLYNPLSQIPSSAVNLPSASTSAPPTSPLSSEDPKAKVLHSEISNILLSKDFQQFSIKEKGALLQKLRHVTSPHLEQILSIDVIQSISKTVSEIDKDNYTPACDAYLLALSPLFVRINVNYKILQETKIGRNLNAIIRYVPVLPLETRRFINDLMSQWRSNVSEHQKRTIAPIQVTNSFISESNASPSGGSSPGLPVSGSLPVQRESSLSSPVVIVEDTNGVKNASESISEKNDKTQQREKGRDDEKEEEKRTDWGASGTGRKKFMSDYTEDSVGKKGEGKVDERSVEGGDLESPVDIGRRLIPEPYLVKNISLSDGEEGKRWYRPYVIHTGKYNIELLSHLLTHSCTIDDDTTSSIPTFSTFYDEEFSRYLEKAQLQPSNKRLFHL